MTASGIKFHERMMRLARYVAPIRIRGRRKVPRRERPAGPKLVVGLWSLWNYGVWGWN